MDRNEAIEIVRRNYPHVSGSGTQFESALRTLIPELKESEDERDADDIAHQNWCKKVLSWLEKHATPQVRTGIEWVNTIDDACDKRYAEEYADGAYCHEQSFRWGFFEGVEWLEKQGSQNLANYAKTCKDEPKFKAGNWYLCVKNFFGKGVRFDKGHAYYCGLNGCLQEFDTGAHIDIDEKLYDYFNLWTIQDAKDGDVLCYKDEISLYKHDIKNCTKQETTFGGFVYHCCCDGERFITDSLYSLTEQDKMDIHPATKEQRDLLFQKIKEAGYEWDAEKMELKKIKQKPTQETESFEAEHGKYYYCIKDYFCGGKKFASKGDVVQALRGLPIMGLKDASEYFLPVNNVQKPAWSKEDEDMLACCEIAIDFFKNLGKNSSGHPHPNYFDLDEKIYPERVIEWLKSFKDRVQPQLQQEWSEEDEDYRLDVNVAVDDYFDEGYAEELRAWLESLKERYTWKPSDEQINTLWDAIVYVIGCSSNFKGSGSVLENLYSDLKKLKG